MDTVKVKIGYAVMKNGRPVRTGRIGARTGKVYETPGPAKALASRTGGTVCEAFIEVEPE